MAYPLKTAVTLVLISLIYGYPIHRQRVETQRIIGGENAPEAYAPHMAALVFGEVVKTYLCGGSVISTRHILTAAHCIDTVVMNGILIPSFRAVVGSNQWASKETVVKFHHYSVHPNWNPATVKNDIGVLYLTDNLELSLKVGIIPLNFRHVEGNEECYVTGWGLVGPRIEGDVVSLAPLPDDLQLLHVNTIFTWKCDIGLRAVSEHYGIPTPPMDPEIEICTYHSVGHGMCNGDSGSALVSRVTGHQIGLVSWGFPCAVGAPDVFVRISAYEDFITSALRQ